MEITIKINCDTQAFQPNAGTELCCILKELADHVDGRTMMFRNDIPELKDQEGNVVGTITVEGRKIPDTPHGKQHGFQREPVKGTLDDMLERLVEGITFMAVHQTFQIWAEHDALYVVCVLDEKDTPTYYPLSIDGLKTILDALAEPYETNDTANSL